MPSHPKPRPDFPLVYYGGPPATPTHLLQPPSNDLGDPAEDAGEPAPSRKVSWWCRLGLHAWHRHEARLRRGSFVSRCRKCERVVVKRRKPEVAHGRSDGLAEDRKVVPLKSRDGLSRKTAMPQDASGAREVPLNRRSDQHP